MPRQVTSPIGVDGGASAAAPIAATASPVVEIGNYHAALRFLNDRVDVERTRPKRIDRSVFKLDRMRALVDALGNPERDVRFVHIAGSKGKGSTAEMVASCLEACGFTVGLFTSPHLVDIRERIRINRHLIGYRDFTSLMGEVAAAAATLEPDHGEPTFFELISALSLLHFARQAVDLAVIEVGLGGRLDSTNIIEPEVTAITAIQLEHTDLLGTSLREIAKEKAGIFKPGVTALSVPQDDEAMDVLRAAAEETGATLEVIGQDVEFSCRFEADTDLGPHARVCVTTDRSSYEHLPVPLKGEHQALNCGLALAVLDKLRRRGFETPERQVALGLAATPQAGRLEIALESPRIILDGAHNPESIAALVKAIGAHIRYDSMVVVFGCAADKNVDGMLQRIALGADKIIFTRSGNNPRAMDPVELQRRFAEISHKMSQIEPNLKEAINTAARAVARDDLICVTGSFYLVGEAKKMLDDLKNKRAAGKK
jgi:dihydrofolate synthase/folylpolyglutamate synthase